MTKENVTRLVAICQDCHDAFPADEMEGYLCVYCFDKLREEPAKTEWDDETGI